MKYKRLLSIVSSILLVFSLLLPGMANAEHNNSEHPSAKQPEQTNKISDRLMDEFTEEENVTFLIKFKEKANTKKVVEDMQNQADSEGLSDHQSSFQQHSAVISELKTTATNAQHNVTNYLEQQVESGNASDIKSYYIVNGMAVTATKEVAQQVSQYDEVEKLLPDETRKLIKSDTLKQKIESDDDSNDIEWNVERVHAPEAWNLGVDGTGTVVASIDSGVEWNHPALKENYRGFDAKTEEVDHNYNWYDVISGSDEPNDDDGHGTHTVGTMVGGETDGSNQIGVAPGAEWIAVKAFSGDEGKDTHLLEAAEWILAPTDEDGNERVDLAPDVVNNSWGGGPGLDEWYREVVQHWREAQIFPEFSAGNADIFNPGGPESILNPANYPESFATGATDVEDELAEFSLRGPSPYDEIKPEISAPGVGIRSSVPGGEYAINHGTSMAGPAVSGTAALLRSANKYIAVDIMEEVLIETANPLTNKEYPDTPNNGYGYGLLDASAAVEEVSDDLGKVEGTVMQEGTDDEYPTYKHEPPEETYPKSDLKVTIRALDNVGVESVELDYKTNNGTVNTVIAEKFSGDIKDGMYTATIPGEDVDEIGNLHYNWWIQDVTGFSIYSTGYDIDIVPGVTAGYMEDFEIEPIHWSSFGENNSWEWGKPQSGPEKAAVGEHVYATHLKGEYDNDSDATLVMPPLDLTDEENPELEFQQWHDFEIGSSSGDPYDFGHVVISEDQEDWTELKTMTGETDGWEDAAIDLSDYSGKVVYVGFQLETDSYSTYEGWYLDDIQLSGEDAPENQSVKNIDVNHDTAEEEPAELPIDAQVSVAETGTSVNTNPKDGTFSMMHQEGEYTVKAEAYGFESDEKTITIEEEVASLDFVLDKMDEGVLRGNILDADTGEAIEGAEVSLIEDANVSPVESDHIGYYKIETNVGTYTLRVNAPGYKNVEYEIDITKDEPFTQDINLEKLHTYPGGEIGYDDGTAENGRALYKAGNGWAVKMSLPEDKGPALVTDGVFKFWDDDFPSPGRNAFEVEVWDSSGKDGIPGEKVAGPIEADAIRDTSEWTIIDLKDENIIVDDDFYIVYIQSQDQPYVPGLATDENGPNAERSYQYIGGKWSETPAEEGNYMIRARVDYEIDTPAITNPDNQVVTNEEELEVEGTASPLTTIQLTNNGDEVEKAEIDEDGLFSIPVELTEGENKLIANTLSDGEKAAESESVTVIQDVTPPEVTIDSPNDGYETNHKYVTVEGTASDEHLENVEVNGEKADVEDDNYSAKIPLQAGSNTIEVIATDQAGNKTSEHITVEVVTDAPVLENMKPETDKYAVSGDTVSVSFTSDSEGGKAHFDVTFPTVNKDEVTQMTNMEEVEPGVYEGEWVVPKNLRVEGAEVTFSLTDKAGNNTSEKADGKLYIYPDKTSRIAGDLRYDTAVETSKKGWKDSDTVILTRGDEFADALSGVPLAYKLDAPILLTPSDQLWEETADEITRLQAKDIIILGGEDAISSNLEMDLVDEGLDVRRIEGDDRFETAAHIADEVAPDGSSEVAVANGMDFPDALSVASSAAKDGIPILLAKEDWISDTTKETIEELDAKDTYVIGGTKVISDSIANELPDANRLSGDDRYGTNVNVLKHFGINSKQLYVGTGEEFADVLTGAVLAAKNDSDILLVHQKVPEVTQDYVTNEKLKHLTIFGGPVAVDDAVQEALDDLLK